MCVCDCDWLPGHGKLCKRSNRMGTTPLENSFHETTSRFGERIVSKKIHIEPMNTPGIADDSEVATVTRDDTRHADASNEAPIRGS